MLLMDKTLTSGKKLVKLLHQTSDTKVQTSSKCKSECNMFKELLFKTIEGEPQSKFVKVAASVSTVAVNNKNRVVDETIQMDLTQGTNQDATANLAQDSTATDQNKSINQIEHINLSEEIAIPHVLTNLDKKEAIHNNEILVANQPEVNKVLPNMADNLKTTQCGQNHLVASQLTNESDGNSMKTPPWIKQNQVISTPDQTLLNIVPLQSIATRLDQYQTVTNQPSPTNLPELLRLQINLPNPNIQQNVVVHQPTVMNLQNLVPTNQIINQSDHQVDQSVNMVAPNQSFLLTQSINNLGQNQVGQNNLGQNINVPQNQNVNKKQNKITSLLEINSLKRKRPKSPAFVERLPKIGNHMSNSKNYDPNWSKKISGNLDKPKDKVEEGHLKDKYVESVVERDKNMPIIKNVISLAPSYVSSRSLGNNNNVGSILQNIVSKPTESIVKQGSDPSTSGESIRKTETKCRKENEENPQRSIIEHTSMIVSLSEAETKNKYTVNSQKIKETQNKSTDATETAQKTSVTNTTYTTIYTERQIIKKSQNDISLRGSELPVLSVKSTAATDPGASNVQAGNCYVQNTRYF